MRSDILGRVKTSSQKLTWTVRESNAKSHTTNLRQKPIISFSFTSMKTWNYEIPFQFLSIPVIGTPVTQPLKRAFTTWAGSTKLSIAGGNYNALREEVNVRLGHFQQREVYWGSHSQWGFRCMFWPPLCHGTGMGLCPSLHASLDLYLFLLLQAGPTRSDIRVADNLWTFEVASSPTIANKNKI